MNRLGYLIAVIAVGAAAATAGPRYGPWRQDELRKAPGFSSPQEYIVPNGDRLSHYPPYYHPEH